MKYHFGENSLKYLKTCHDDLKILMSYALATTPIDFAVVSGYRNEEQQNELFKNGKSERMFPYSLHNEVPALAVDFLPYPVTPETLKIVGEHIKKCAQILKIEISWGGDWKTLLDSPHIELRGEKYGIKG